MGRAAAADPEERRIDLLALVMLVPCVGVLALATASLIGVRSAFGVAVAVGLLAAVAGLQYAAAGVVGVTVLCVIDAPARVFVFTGDPLPWNTLNYWLLFTIVVHLPLVGRLRDPHTWLLAAFVAVIGVQLLPSTDLALGVQHTLSAVASVGVLVTFVRGGPSLALRRAVATVGGAVGAAAGCVCVVQSAAMSGFNPNAWALTPLAGLLALCYGARAQQGVWGRSTHLLLGGLNLSWIFLSGSRGTLVVGLCCAVHLVLSLPTLTERAVSLAAAGLAAVTVAASFPALRAVAIHRVTKSFQTEAPGGRDVSLSERSSGRSDLALGGWYIFLEHPFGVGTGGFPVAWRDLRRTDGLTDFGRGHEKSAHSGWVETLAESGVVGTSLLAAYVVSFAVVGARARAPARRRLGLLAGAAVGSMLFFSEFEGKAMWFIAGAATAALHYHRPRLGPQR